MKKSKTEFMLEPFIQLGVSIRDNVTNFVQDFVNDVKFVTTRDFSEVVTPKTVFLAGGSTSTSSARTAQAKRRVNASDSHGSNNMTMFEKVHSDSEYGGASTCSSEVVFAQDDSPQCEGEAIASYVRFQGHLNFTSDRNAKRKTFGFCAAQAICLRTMDLKVSGYLGC
jgi:hypothetical protein